MLTVAWGFAAVAQFPFERGQECSAPGCALRAHRGLALHGQSCCLTPQTEEEAVAWVEVSCVLLVEQGEPVRFLLGMWHP